MKFSQIIFGFLMIVLSAASANAGYKECPVEMGDDYLPKVLDTIRGQSSCYMAADIAITCGMGSSMDIEIAGQARASCEHRFVNHLKPAEMENYKVLLNKCLEKYVGHQGTLYLSAQAFCELNIAQAFDSAYTPFEDDDNGKPASSAKK